MVFGGGAISFFIHRQAVHSDLENLVLWVRIFINSGKPPFPGKDNSDILNNILTGTYDFKLPVWEAISDSAKDLISKLLNRNADERLTSSEAFHHPWVQRQKDLESANVDISIDVINNMKVYMESINFKRTTLHLIASRIPEDQIKALR